jgi:hypothetical protein
MGRIVVGLALLAAGVVGLVVFQEPVGTYTAEIAGSGDEAGQIVEVECVDGAVVGRFAGDERAESECAVAEDSVENVRIVKLAVSALVAVIGIWLIVVGVRARWRDFRSRLEYRRMIKDRPKPTVGS